MSTAPPTRRRPLQPPLPAACVALALATLLAPGLGIASPDGRESRHSLDGTRASALREARHLPEPCRPIVEADRDAQRSEGTTSPEREWNRLYRRGHEAIESGDLHLAEEATCRALVVSRGFPARDPRFAETLDELGLIHFLWGDDAAAARAQGSAVAEALLALGPGAREVELYASRLGRALRRQQRESLARELRQHPDRIFGSGLVTLDAALARRLDWLVSQYLLREDLAAAGRLQALVDEVEREARLEEGR